jgi:hypothetical protein
MADHFVSLNRGEQGFQYADFTTGTSSTAGDRIELRVTDSSVTIKDVIVALEAFERFMENAQQTSTAGFLFLNN